MLNLGGNNKVKTYEAIAHEEKNKADGFQLIKEYEHFYLKGKYQNGEMLYKECFSKFDVDGHKNPEKSHNIYQRRYRV